MLSLLHRTVNGQGADLTNAFRCPLLPHAALILACRIQEHSAWVAQLRCIGSAFCLLARPLLRARTVRKFASVLLVSATHSTSGFLLQRGGVADADLPLSGHPLVRVSRDMLGNRGFCIVDLIGLSRVP